jgi:hypothetical protein
MSHSTPRRVASRYAAVPTGERCSTRARPSGPLRRVRVSEVANEMRSIGLRRTRTPLTSSSSSEAWAASMDSGSDSPYWPWPSTSSRHFPSRGDQSRTPSIKDLRLHIQSRPTDHACPIARRGRSTRHAESDYSRPWADGGSTWLTGCDEVFRRFAESARRHGSGRCASRTGRTGRAR